MYRNPHSSIIENSEGRGQQILASSLKNADVVEPEGAPSTRARAALALRHDVAPGRRRHPRGVMAGECLLRHPAHEHAVLRRAVGTDARQSTHRAESRGRLRRRAERRERQQEEPEHHVVQAQRPEEESGVGGGLERRIPRRVGVRRARTIGEAPSQESRRDGQRTRGAGVLRRRGGVRRRVRLQRRRDVEKSNRQRPGLHRPGVLPAPHERLARYVYFYLFSNCLPI